MKQKLKRLLFSSIIKQSQDDLPFTIREKVMIKWFFKFQLSIILIILSWVTPLHATLTHIYDYQELTKQVASIQSREAHAQERTEDKADAVGDRAGDVGAEQEYYKLIETNEAFRNYIDGINVYRNNPGNLRFANQPGARYVHGFASWSDVRTGFRALIKQIELDQSRNLSLEAFYNKFAPPEDSNDTESLIYEAEKLFNVTRKININELDTIRFAQYITFREHSVAIVNY